MNVDSFQVTASGGHLDLPVEWRVPGDYDSPRKGTLRAVLAIRAPTGRPSFWGLVAPDSGSVFMNLVVLPLSDLREPRA